MQDNNTEKRPDLRLRHLREMLRLSQAELGLAFGFSQRAIAYYDDGTRPIPTKLREKLYSIGVSPEWLESGNGPMVRPGIRLDVVRNESGITVRPSNKVGEPEPDYSPSTKHVIEFDGPGGWAPTIPGENHPGGVSLGYWGHDRQFHLIDSVAHALETAVLWFEEETANRPTIQPRKKALIIRKIAEELIEASASGGEYIDVFTKIRDGVRKRLRDLLELAG